MPKLLVRHPEQGDLTFTLSGDRITVGRHSDNHIQIRHATVSGHHAEIISRNGRYVIRDLDSTNHSYFGGVMFIEAEMDRACQIVLGTIPCEFLPDNVDTVPEEMDTLRKTVGLLRRQNDELVAKIAEQKNQIDILGNVKLLTREASCDLVSNREQVKVLTLERDRIALENAELVAQVEVLHAKLGIPSISKAAHPVMISETAASMPPRLPKPAVPLGETVMVPSPHANSGGR